MRDTSAIDYLRQGRFPSEWTFNIVQNKAAFSGAKTPSEHFAGDCNRGLRSTEILEKWDSELRTRFGSIQRKNGLGLLTGEVSGGIIAVDVDDAEGAFAEFMGSDYPDIESPGTMSWRGKPGNRQLLYRVPKNFQSYFLKFTKAQLVPSLIKRENSEVCLRYNGCYSVLPGSIHPNADADWGRDRYEWISENEAVVAPLPSKILKWMMANCAEVPDTTQFLPPELQNQIAPVSGKNYTQLCRDFKKIVLLDLVAASDVEDPKSLIWKLFHADVWNPNNQPLMREHGNPSNPLVGGCPFHQSSSGRSFAIWPDIKGEGPEKGHGLFGWICHKEDVKGDAIALLHALRTGDIEADRPDALTLENYLIEAGKLLGKKYPEDFEAAISFRREVKYDETKHLLDWAREIEEEFENPAQQDIELAQLLSDHNLRVSVDQVRQWMQDDSDYKRGGALLNCDERKKGLTGMNFIIPDVLLSPSTVLLHGNGGAGKSQAALAIAKHILKGKEFKVRGELMPVVQGPVIWCNGDQSPEAFELQLESHGLENERHLHVLNEFRLKHTRKLARKINEIKPQLVIIDSLSGCMPGADNNKQEVCRPLYWLENVNGSEFPNTCFLIIHHNNKSGTYRGHSGIADAVTETMGIEDLSDEEIQSNAYGVDGEMRRKIVIGKSRVNGRQGDQFITLLNEDFSMDIEDFTPCERRRKYSGKISVIDKILSFIRTNTSRGLPTSREELETTLRRPSKDNTIRSSLKRLKLKGHIVMFTVGEKKENRWFAATAQGLELTKNAQNPVVDKDVVERSAFSQGERDDVFVCTYPKPVGTTKENGGVHGGANTFNCTPLEGSEVGGAAPPLHPPINSVVPSDVEEWCNSEIHRGISDQATEENRNSKNALPPVSDFKSINDDFWDED